MVDDGLGFQLVPWRPALEHHLGREVTGTITPGGGIDWSYDRRRAAEERLQPFRHGARQGRDGAAAGGLREPRSEARVRRRDCQHRPGLHGQLGILRRPGTR